MTPTPWTTDHLVSMDYGHMCAEQTCTTQLPTNGNQSRNVVRIMLLTVVRNAVFVTVPVACHVPRVRALAYTPAKPELRPTTGAGCNVNEWVFSHAAGPAN